MIHRPTPVLQPFAVRFLSGSPVAPATGATIRFFKQGATVPVAFGPIPDNSVATVPVYHPGALTSDDIVQLGTDESVTLTVEGVDSDVPSVDLRNQTGGPVSIAANTRLVRIADAAGSDPALIFSDPVGETTGVGSRTLIAADDGWVIGYVIDYRYDLVVTGGGYTPWLATDWTGSWIY